LKTGKTRLLRALFFRFYKGGHAWLISNAQIYA